MYYLAVNLLVVPLLLALFSPIILGVVIFKFGLHQAGRLAAWMFIGGTYWIGVQLITVIIPGSIWVDTVSALILGIVMGIIGWFISTQWRTEAMNNPILLSKVLLFSGSIFGFLEGYRTILIPSFNDSSRIIPAVICAVLGAAVGYMMQWHFKKYHELRRVFSSGVVALVIIFILGSIPVILRG